MDNKHMAMYQYIAQYPQAEGLFFNVDIVENDKISFAPAFSDEVVKRYVDGSAEKEYDFAIAVFKPLSDMPHSTENIAGLYDVQKFMRWIDEQNESKIYPDFGEKCTVHSITNLQNMPNMAGQDERHIKYMFQCRVSYFEKN